jgi:hypothetical protein
VGVPDALGACALGGARMGVAFLERTRPVRTLRRPERGKRHKKITDWARQMLLVVRRWWPEREIVAVADAGYASLRLLASCRRFLPKAVTFVTRLRLDAALYAPAPPRRAKQMGRPRLKGERLPNLSVVAEDPSTSASFFLKVCGLWSACGA